MFRLDGRTALVTGAGGGIGAAVSTALAEAGARVMVTDVAGEAAAAVAARICAAGGAAESAALDVRDPERAAEVATLAAGDGGQLNILVNNAGVIAPAMLDDLDIDRFRMVVEIHLLGTYVCSRASLPLLATDGTGRIINVTSAAGLTGTIGQANYGAAKAGVIGLTKSMAKELARRQILVNALAPLAATTMTETVRTHEKLAAKTLERIPLGRWAEPAEVAGAFVFLAGDAASYITGQVLPVDGGTVI